MCRLYKSLSKYRTFDASYCQHAGFRNSHLQSAVRPRCQFRMIHAKDTVDLLSRTAQQVTTFYIYIRYDRLVTRLIHFFFVATVYVHTYLSMIAPIMANTNLTGLHSSSRKTLLQFMKDISTMTRTSNFIHAHAGLRSSHATLQSFVLQVIGDIIFVLLPRPELLSYFFSSSSPI